MLAPKPQSGIDETSHAEVAEKMFLLRRAELFAQLDDEDLRQVAILLRTRMFSEGDVIIQEGSLDRDVFIIKSGSVSVEAGGVRVESLGPGAVVGELAAIDPAPRSASVIASEPSCVYRLSADAFLGVLEERPEIVEGLLAVLCRRLRRRLQSGVRG